MKRYARYSLIEMPAKRWFHYFSIEDRDGEWYDAFILRLPSWGYGYSIINDGEMWGQRVLRWHSKRGFSLGWDFQPESSITVTPPVSGLDR